MTSSLRECSLEETLAKARAIAPQLGITRVTDTTWLDRVGIPVFASIRPSAQRGSLCVNAGKGLRPAEAQVGAYMEAIEFAAAEFRSGDWSVEFLGPSEIAGQESARFDFIDLCPLLGRKVNRAEKLPCVAATDITTGERVFVPAELVFQPFTGLTGPRLFGSSSNGLSSGNSALEAAVHGLAELLERDVHAFHLIRDRSRPIDLDTVTGHPAELVRLARAADLDVVLRASVNEFGLPFFQAYLLEREDTAPVAIAFGAGLHTSRDIAAVRAIAEAAQSRLSHIHGGRDDIIDRHDYFAKSARQAETQATRQLRAKVSDREGLLSMSDVPDPGAEVDSIATAGRLLRETASKAGIHQVLTVDLTPVPDAGLHVVRVLAPGLESFQHDLQRVGRRLASLASAGHRSEEAVA
ncbi:YcaO-like family protein [Streptomyces sp. DT2A-34]|uniref:YcaO-like family protein n=1 Tax=Streptomyces sp. DT2A-34 TaxID=3051182 RepID=UPI00265C3066|nr:YcaO-like family protein [Streptomyces sp. DT2A-34]MDO0914347.1 YcaO-like family protein [Streptomyces sp. DT2A-34]